MFRIAALNLSDYEDEEEDSSNKGRTKEAQEEEAFSLYTKALGILRQGKLVEAEETFCQLLDSRLVREASRSEQRDVQTQVQVHPGVQLKYSTHKNLASIAAQRDNYERAMEQYIEAVKLDNTDVTVWYKAGLVAKKIHNYQLAKFAFSQGLLCNPHHWPCLDGIITVLFAIHNYSDCLYYIGKALQKDSGYLKGLVMRKQIFNEFPYLYESTKTYFEKCVVHDEEIEVTQAEVTEVLLEAEQIREICRSLSVVQPAPPLTMKRCMQEYSWLELGLSLLVQYDYCHNRGEPESLSAVLDLSDVLESARAPSGDRDVVMTSPELNVTSQASLLSMAITTNVVVAPSEMTSVTTTMSASEVTLTPSSQLIDVDTIPSERPSTLVVTSIPETTVRSSPLVTSTGQINVTLDSPISIDVDTPIASTTTTTTSVANLPDFVAMATDSVPMETEVQRALFTTDHGYARASNTDPSLMSNRIPGITEERSSPIDVDAARKRGARRRTKSSPISLFDEELYSGKRRSLRVRNTDKRHQQKKKEEVSVDYSELLLKFLPSSLVSVSESDEQSDIATIVATSSQGPDVDISRLPSTQDPNVLLVTKEKAEVQKFLLDREYKWCTLTLLTAYLHELADRADLIWPEKLPGLFIKLYASARRHFEYPCYYDCGEETKEIVRDKIKLCLTWAELQVDAWNQSKLKTPTSTPAMSPAGGTSISPIASTMKSDPEFPGEYFPAEMHYIIGLTAFPDIVQDYWAEYRTRVLWLKVKFHAMKNEISTAVNVMAHIGDFLQHLQDEMASSQPISYRLVNCVVDNLITKDTVRVQLDSLQRCQSLEELQRLYNNHQYESVVKLLLPTFSNPAIKGKLMVNKPVIPERHAQLMLLQDALIHLGDRNRCLLWGEESLNEALGWYQAALTDQEKDDWGATMVAIFQAMYNCLSVNTSIISALPSRSTVRLVRNLIRAIEITMNQQTAERCTLLPWILLYYFIAYEEDRLRSLRTDGATNDWELGILSSLMFLDVSHDLLGRRAWCSRSEGALLTFYASRLQKALNDDVINEHLGEYRADLEESLEQCFYCLYGYPSKRRARNLSDHGAVQITLTWDKATDLFDYFKPKSMPEFDSYKVSTVSGEQESLLRRILQLVPAGTAPPVDADSISCYIDGQSEAAPLQQAHSDVPILSEIYYLLGDYHFKNKEFMKAVKFYMQDLTYNPCRFDSWAGMALARSSKLEQKLNSMDSKCESTIHKQASCALRSYRRSLELDDSNTKLWIEYGTFAYQLHSYWSRQVKLKSVFALSGDAEDAAETSRLQMLQLAEMCYKEAGQCDSEEEPWLQHYILGKIAEKLCRVPSVWLDHYSRAAQHLHDDGAKYPRKIHYIATPAHLAVESLEIYYRTHVSILKFLMKLENRTKVNDDVISVFERFIRETADGPFANSRHKKPDTQESESRDGNDQECSRQTIKPVPVCRSVSEVSAFSADDSLISAEVSAASSTDESLEEASTTESGGKTAPTDDSMDEAGLMEVASALLIKKKNLDAIDSENATYTDQSQDSPMPVDMDSSELCTSMESEDIIEAVKIETREMDRSQIVILVQEIITDLIDCLSINNAEILTELTDSKSAIGDVTYVTDFRLNIVDENGSCDRYPATQAGIDETAKGGRVTGSVPKCDPDVPKSQPGDALRSMSGGVKRKLTDMEDTPTTESLKRKIPLKGLEHMFDDTKDDVFDGRVVELEEERAAGSVISSDSNLQDDSNYPNEALTLIREADSCTDVSQKDGNVDALVTDEPEVEKSSPHINYVAKECLDELVVNVLDVIESLLPVQPPQPTVCEMLIDDLLAETTANSEIKTEVCGTLDAINNLNGTEGITWTKQTVEKASESEIQIVNERNVDSTNDNVSVNEAESTREEKLELKNGSENGVGVTKEDKSEEESRRESKTDVDSKKASESEVEPKIEIEMESKESDSNSFQNCFAETLNSLAELANLSGSSVPSQRPILHTTYDGDDDDDDGFVTMDIESESDMKSGGIENGRQSSENKPPIQLLVKSEIIENDKYQEANDSQITDSAVILTEPDCKTEVIDINPPTINVPVEISRHKPEMSKQDVTADCKSSFKESESGIDDEELDKRSQKVVEACIEALHVCLSRFPTHYKSQYHLAKLYYSSPWHKNIAFCRDLLAGTADWQQMAHMPCPGLFQDRKVSNLFSGVWRIPIEEIDRCGSFATHMYRSVDLLMRVLVDVRDVTALYSCHLQLQKNPEGNKKYLRDAERIVLARRAFTCCLDALEKAVTDTAQPADADKFLLSVYKIWSVTNKTNVEYHRVNTALITAFKRHKPQQVVGLDDAQITELATKTCAPLATPKTTSKRENEDRLSATSSVLSVGRKSPPYKDVNRTSTPPVVNVRGTSAVKLLKPCSVRLVSPLHVMKSERNSAGVVTVTKMTSVLKPVGVVTADKPESELDVDSLSSDSDVVDLIGDESSPSDKDSDYNPTDDENFDEEDAGGRRRKRAKLSPGVLAKQQQATVLSAMTSLMSKNVNRAPMFTSPRVADLAGGTHVSPSSSYGRLESFGQFQSTIRTAQLPAPRPRVSPMIAVAPNGVQRKRAPLSQAQAARALCTQNPALARFPHQNQNLTAYSPRLVSAQPQPTMGIVRPVVVRSFQSRPQGLVNSQMMRSQQIQRPTPRPHPVALRYVGPTRVQNPKNIESVIHRPQANTGARAPISAAYTVLSAAQQSRTPNSGLTRGQMLVRQQRPVVASVSLDSLTPYQQRLALLQRQQNQLSQHAQSMAAFTVRSQAQFRSQRPPVQAFRQPPPAHTPLPTHRMVSPVHAHSSPPNSLPLCVARSAPVPDDDDIFAPLFAPDVVDLDDSD